MKYCTKIFILTIAMNIALPAMSLSASEKSESPLSAESSASSRYDYHRTALLAKYTCYASVASGSLFLVACKQDIIYPQGYIALITLTGGPTALLGVLAYRSFNADLLMQKKEHLASAS